MHERGHFFDRVRIKKFEKVLVKLYITHLKEFGLLDTLNEELVDEDKEPIGQE